MSGNQYTEQGVGGDLTGKGDTTALAARAGRHGKDRQRHPKRPCGTPPSTPTGLLVLFDVNHKLRQSRLRAKLRWTEVTTDVQGHPTKIRRYDVAWAFSLDNVTWDEDTERYRVPAKDDTDPGPMAHLVIRGIRRAYYYRFRVRAVDRDCPGAWSAWTAGISPSDTSIPPLPLNVDLRINQRKARIKWDSPVETTASYTPGPDDAALSEIPHPDVAFYQVQLDTASTFNTPNLQKDMFQAAEYKVFRITKPNATGPNWWARVRSVSATHRVSAWVVVGPTWLGALPTPAAPSVAFDALGPRHNLARAVVTVSTYSPAQLTAHDDDIAYYTVQVAIAATHPPGTPPAGARRKHQRVLGDETGDDLAATFGSIRKDHFVYARERVVDKEGKQSPWSAWTDAGSPIGGTPAAPTNVVDVSTHKLAGIRWDTPMAADGIRPDESIAHYQVQAATTSAFTNILEQAKHIIGRQFRWKATVGVQVFMRVRSVDSLGGVSPWAPADTGLGVTAGDDGDPIGHIKKVHHPVNAPPALTDQSYLHCNGAAVSRTTFAALFAKIGTRAGAGDGVTTFNLPDHRGKHAIGVSTSATHPSKDLGARDDNLTDATNVDHSHDSHTPEADNLDHSTDIAIDWGDNPEGAHGHNAGSITVGPSFGEVQRGNQALMAAGPNHGHGLSGVTGSPLAYHGHSHTHPKGGRHPKPNQKADHAKNHAPWLAVHYVIRAV